MDNRKTKIYLGATFVGLALFYTLPYFLNLHNWGIRDWDLFSTISAVPLGTISHYGQFPFWNPYTLGGNILFHHPEVLIFSPFILLYALFGVIVGLKLQVAICYLIGFWGSYRLARSFELSLYGSILMSVAYFGSVHFSLHFAEGHLPFTHFCFLPWFIYYVKESVRQPRNMIWGAVVLALMVLGNGGAIPMLYTLLFSGLLISLLAITTKNWLIIRNLFIAAIGGLTLAAIKFIPMIAYLTQNKWEGAPEESIPFSALDEIFFGLNHSLITKNFPEQFWGWHEYGAYLSPLLVLLAIVALVTKFRKVWPLGLLALFFFLLGLGDHGSFSPWVLLSHLPGFSSTRCTGRSFQFVILTVALLGAFGFDEIIRRFKENTKVTLTIIVTCLAIIGGSNMALAWPIASEAFTRPEQFVIRNGQFEHVVEGSQSSYLNYLENKGSLVAPVLSAYKTSRGLVDPLRQVRREHVQSGQATIISSEYTPNVITYRIVGIKPGQLIIGMGYDEGWSVDDGRPVGQSFELISVPFEVGVQEIVLRYQTPFFWWGFLVSLLGLIGLGLALFFIPKAGPEADLLGS